ncbi:MAG: AAA family ATPase [Pirellulales bacterium]
MARYKWLVVAVVVGFTGVGLVFGYLREPSFEATATLVLEEPSGSLLVDPQPATPRQAEQYLAEQEELLTSLQTAERAAELATVDDPNAGLTAVNIWRNVSTTSDVDTGFVKVSFLGTSSEVSALGANTVVLAYEEVRLQQILDGADAQLASLDAALELLAEDLQELEGQIVAELPLGRDQLDAQLDAALTELVDLQERRPDATGQDLEDIRAQTDDLFSELQTSNLYRSLEAQQPELAPLLTRRNDLLELEQELAKRRDLVQIEKELADIGVVLFSPARQGREQGIGILPLLVVLAVLGAVVAGFLAYYLALRKRSVLSSRDPEMVLKTPLLAEIPSFIAERIQSTLPVADHPESGVAEAFRFLASSIVFREMQKAGEPVEMRDSQDTAGTLQALGHTKLLAVISGSVGDGKTTVVANTALAAARAGNRVLAIDADFSGQQLVQLLAKEDSTQELGLTDVTVEKVRVDQAVSRVESGIGRLDLMGRGTIDIPAGTFFQAEELEDFFTDLKQQYDLIFIDTPPLLQVAYAGLVARLADEAIVVVRHNSDMLELEEVRARLEMTGTPSIGYAYNGAPLRRRLAGPEGSIGEDGFRA